MPAAIAISAALSLAVPAAAAAANTYADADTGDDSADCLSPATACVTIGAALSKSAPGDTTFVAGIFDNASITVDQGKSLLPSPSAPVAPLLNGRAGTAITIDASGAGTVGGLRIRADSTPMQVNGPVTIDGNAFDVDNGGCLGGGGSDINVQTDAPVAITNNGIIACSDSGASQTGVAIDSPAAGTEISNNSFDNLAVGVTVLAGDATITANRFAASASDPSTGVFVNETVGPARATLSRNEIFGQDVGVDVVDSSSAVTLSNDLIHDNVVGLEATDSSADTPDPSTQGDVSATNATIYSSSDTDVRLDHTTLTLDSSILGTPIDLVGGEGACSISYSRGATTTPGGSGCQDFQTIADPEFVDTSSGDYHLQPTSTLIDIGNPADPGPGAGAMDFYGDPRAVQGNACDTVRRDIGAAEFQPGSPPQCAQDTYADAGAPDDNNDCLSPATACKTIGAALAKAGPSQTTFVADGTYDESIELSEGKSLVSLDPTDPRPIVDGGGQKAIWVRSGGAGSVSGFRLRSEAGIPMGVDGTVDIDDNVFDEDNVQSFQADVRIESGATGVMVHDNAFEDPDASGVQFGILNDEDPSDTVISDNTFTDLSAGVVVAAGEPQISANQFSDLRAIGSTPFGSLPGAGVLVLGGDPTVAQNTFGPAAEHPVAGVYIKPVAPSLIPAGATLRRNRIFGNDAGVQVVDSNAPVTLSDNLIYGNGAGLEATDSSGDSPGPSTQGDVSATNETIFDNDVDVQLEHTTLTLDSSILGTPIDLVGNGACSIAYSRGSSAASINGCANFATNADPQFVNAAAGDYHLQSTSPLIDLGNPADPGLGVTDFYGGPRAVLGQECSTVRRDIGGDEHDPATTPGCTPPPPQPPPPDTSSAEPPPPPKIGKRPDKHSDDTSPTFRFTSEVAGSTFRCKLDDGPYKRCSSPKTYHGLDPDPHIFRVYAIDPSGEKGKPRVFRFTIVKQD